MTQAKPDFIEIKEVRYHPEYKLELAFNDGTKNTIDFEPFLKKAQHPDVKKYLNKKRFKGYTFEYGHLHWNDYDLSFSIDDLHDGKI
jgi:uncharacterized protein YjbK